MPETVDIAPVGTERLRDVLSSEQLREFEAGAAEARDLLADRTVWNVNSTARGGGVAELLRPLVGYARGLGIDCRWAVIGGEQGFFDVTKRLHNRLHGAGGDRPLDDAARRTYEDTLRAEADPLGARVRERDVVILHDPQTAGLVEPLRRIGASVIWRCHIGLDEPNDTVRGAWDFLRPYVEDADAFIFSRAAFAWEQLDRRRIHLIAPSIDAFAPKNQDLEPDVVRAVLHATGLLHDGEPPAPATFARHDGSPGRVERPTELYEDAPLRSADPVVVQVSRWDKLKDPLGVIRGFAEHVEDAHLVYAGPAVAAVADDPEGEQVLRDALRLRERLPDEARRRIHLACIPMDDPEENAIVVNALQRHARVVVQKSLAEGFGLTVAEAMWKARPVVASRIGGIQDQIVDGESGVLLDDPADLTGFGAAVSGLLADTERAERIGDAARERVRSGFLSSRSLLDHLAVVRAVLEGAAGTHAGPERRTLT
jgi:trehalose synthase